MTKNQGEKIKKKGEYSLDSAIFQKLAKLIKLFDLLSWFVFQIRRTGIPVCNALESPPIRFPTATLRTVAGTGVQGRPGPLAIRAFIGLQTVGTIREHAGTLGEMGERDKVNPPTQWWSNL